MLKTYSLTKDTLLVSSESDIKILLLFMFMVTNENISNLLNINMTLK